MVAQCYRLPLSHQGSPGNEFTGIESLRKNIPRESKIHGCVGPVYRFCANRQNAEELCQADVNGCEF